MSDFSLILVINCGSSSVKFSLFDIDNNIEVAAGLADRLGTKQAQIKWHLTEGEVFECALKKGDHLDAVSTVVSQLQQEKIIDQTLSGIGHRVVHGGEYFKASTVIDESVIEKIEACASLAPLHNPANVLGIRTLQNLFPNVTQVAVFDTAFHQTIPKHAYLYPLPYTLYKDHGVRRYGFHGTSHDYVASKAVELLALDTQDHAIVCAHLGNGCSATAVRNGQSIDTTMGMTPLEGLCMGTRCGDIDPSIHQYLCEKMAISINELTDILNKQSGLLGISQTSNDMRNLSQAADSGDKYAALAIEVFCYRLAKHIAALCVPLGKLDALVFTGGIGENAANIRAKVIAQLGILGLKLNGDANIKNGKNTHQRINAPNSPAILVINTQEEWYIANATRTLVG